MAAALFSCPQVRRMGDPGEEDSSVSSSSISSSCSSCADRSPPTTTTTNSNNATNDVPMLLEGDVLAVSLDGIARSCYHLTTTATNSAGRSALCIEERYDLRRARKTFLVREMDVSGGGSSSNLCCSSATNMGDQGHGLLSPMGRLLGSVDIQEMDQRCFVYAAGDQTGGSTWEASIAMALYIAAHEPSLLSGRIIELGCGIGLGGILTTQMVPLLLQQQHTTTEKTRDSISAGTRGTNITSVTLTDGNEQVLHKCRRNVHAARLLAAATSSSLWAPSGADNNNNNKTTTTTIPPVFVKRLDWNNIPDEDRHMYNVVVACDAVYKYADVEPLGKALEMLLVQQQQNNGQDNDGQPMMMIHLFAPYNRGALEHLSVYLREALDLQVAIEWVEMDRYRLKPQKSNNNNNKRSRKNGNINSSSSWSSDQQWWRDNPELKKTDTDIVLGDAVEEDDRTYASKSTAKFLHITATRKEAKNCRSNDNQNEHDSSSSSLEDID